ncbi:hypothetical protein RB653_009439 [Dictyostelium firmibasis]|uniref:Uncharacterized protein n=1 Tax=Dictyostelium firmibasis TaxID=79012 RepID=A0AAN7UEA9_9MYCE
MIKSTTKWSQKVASSLGDCSIEMSVYGACVTSNLDNIEKNVCKAEFEKFKNCMAKSMASKKKKKMIHVHIQYNNNNYYNSNNNENNNILITICQNW